MDSIIIEILKYVFKALKKSFSESDSFTPIKKDVFMISSKQDIDKNIYSKPINHKANNLQNNINITSVDDKFYNNNDADKSSQYNRKRSKFVIQENPLDSIVEDLTSSKLEQAIVLSEIVGRPKSKTRKRRLQY